MSETREISTRRDNFAGRIKTEGFYNSAVLDGVQNVGNKAKKGPTYCNLGDAYYELGDFKQALNNHELYLNTIELRDRAGEGRAYGCLGKDHRGLGNFEQAINYHEQQHEIAVETRDRAEESRACENLGNTCYSMGNFKAAIEWYKRALCIAEEIEDKAIIGKLNRDIGNSYFRDGAFEDAIEHHLRDLRLAEELEDKGVACGNLGNAYFSLCYFETAVEYQKLNLNIAREVGDSAEEGKASYDLGCSFECMGNNLDEALNRFHTSLNTFEDIQSRDQSEDEWKINIQNKYKLVVIALCRILLKQNKIEKALSFAEKGRAQALMYLLKSKYGFETSAVGEENNVENIVHNILSNLLSTAVFLAIDKNDINIWVLKGNSVHFRKSEIGEICLEDDETLSFASLTQAAYPIPEDEIRSLATSAGEAEDIRQQQAELMKKALRILYDVVISPVADLLEGDELIIVPDGPLCVAPFSAFIVPESNCNSEPKYLCESYRIRVNPSLTCLKLIVDSSQYHSRKGILLVGNPCLEEVVTNKPWKLPKAEEEVTVIGEILNSEPLIGEAATKEEVLRRLKSVTLVHIAAQGIDENGEILLTPNPSRSSEIPELEDYLLSISDVMGIQLRARLVVLSCCHSAQGKIKAEGAVGIARAFLAAGARCVLVALWEINDEATLDFMKSFYEQLVVGKRASVALNQAMKNLKESQEFGDVKDWAAFQLIGDDVALEFEEEE
ncbi:hypothetical protein ACROYT_G028837 [Oculina patagonica]